MDASKQSRAVLENLDVNVKVKLTALWRSVMFLCAYEGFQHFVLQTALCHPTGL
jgi:hypothetical protein